MGYVYAALYTLTLLLIALGLVILLRSDSSPSQDTSAELYFSDEPPDVIDGEGKFSFIIHNHAAYPRTFRYNVSIGEVPLCSGDVFLDEEGVKRVTIGLRGGNITGITPIRVKSMGLSIHSWSWFR